MTKHFTTERQAEVFCCQAIPQQAVWITSADCTVHTIFPIAATPSANIQKVASNNPAPTASPCTLAREWGLKCSTSARRSKDADDVRKPVGQSKVLSNYSNRQFSASIIIHLNMCTTKDTLFRKVFRSRFSQHSFWTETPASRFAS